MEVSSAPTEIVTLAEERAAARAARDWPTADELKIRIEAAGWRVIDDGVDFSLLPARPSDLVEGGLTFYGAVESVPSRFGEPAAVPATVVVIDGGDTETIGATVHALETQCPNDTQVLVVADRPHDIETTAVELVRTAEPFSPGDALQAALHRAVGEVIVVLEPERRPSGDLIGPLSEALRDPAVAVVALEGLQSADLQRYGPAQDSDVTTVRSGCYAFRRADAIARGPIDGRLRLRGSVAAWWGLLLRDEGADLPPRNALVIDLPLERPEGEAVLPDDHSRRARRDGYRIADRFRGHDWLVSQAPPQGRLVGDGAHDDDGHDDSDEARDTSES